jgi:hypothetical protein
LRTCNLYLITELDPWYDSPITKILADFESLITLISLLGLWIIFFKRKKIPYWLSYSFRRILRKKYYYLSCNNHKTSDDKLFKTQSLAFKINKILLNTGINSGKPNSIGLNSWILEGEVPVQETLQLVEKLISKSFTEEQNGYYLELKTLWKRELNFTIDSKLYVVFLSSVFVISGMVLREAILNSAFLKIIKHVEHKSMRTKEQFLEKHTNDVLDFLSFLIENKVDREDFLEKAKMLFIEENFFITLDIKDDLEKLFMQKSTPGGNDHDY